MGNKKFVCSYVQKLQPTLLPENLRTQGPHSQPKENGEIWLDFDPKPLCDISVSVVFTGLFFPGPSKGRLETRNSSSFITLNGHSMFSRHFSCFIWPAQKAEDCLETRTEIWYFPPNLIIIEGKVWGMFGNSEEEDITLIIFRPFFSFFWKTGPSKIARKKMNSEYGESCPEMLRAPTFWFVIGCRNTPKF